MGMHAESTKAQRYISELDEARCAGRWKDVPELCRKVEKHAPHRRCLTLTARSEAQVVAYSTQRPATAASTVSSGLSTIIPALLTAVEEEGDHVQDAFQATVCLGWLHYVLDEPGLAIARLPKDFAAVAAKMERQALSGWARVCIVKGTFLKGSSMEKTGATEDAIPYYSSIIPWLSSKPIHTETPQFKMWTEHLLVRLCHLSDQSSDASDYTDSTDALHTYRFWAKYWEGNAKTGGTEGQNAARYRRLAWKAYYDTLSVILRHGLHYEAELQSTDPGVSEKHYGTPNTKLQQRAELRRVEAIYEGLLLKETHFPKASESNTEIEQWVDAVIDNWRFVCGPTWSDADLGEGGKEAVGRGVLDILYRAATKTFHSTKILRHLFTVHASLADFDLAFKAYDSYVEIITRCKDRAERSGEEDASIDDDSAVLRTSAIAIRVLCRFGSAKEAEKALEISHHVEKWLEQSENFTASTSEAGSIRSVETFIELKSLASAYSAIGICHAHWARFTYDADARSSLQAKAVQYLRRSLAPRLGEPNNIEALYALALVLAETRDITGAIKVVKRALSPASKQKSSISADVVITPGLSSGFGRERKLIPLWHLLALLLTSRSEYSAAERACEAAFEQFGDPAVLFGKQDDDAYRSEHLNEASGKQDSLGIIDQMEGFEKSGVLQVKMTQLSLLEIGDGSAAAVDGCDELLALYARLFGEVSAAQAKPPPATSMLPPKSAVGTIRGSIFRSKGSVKTPQHSNRDRNSSVASSAPSTIATQTAAAPAIQVTDEDGANRQHRHRLSHHKHRDEQTGIQRSPSKLQKRSANSLRRKSEVQAEQAPEVPQLPEGATNGTPARSSTVRSRSSRRASVSSSPRKSSESHERSLRPIPYNMSHVSEPPSVGHTQQPLQQDIRLPAPFPNPYYIPPDPHFSKVQSRRQKVSLLVSVWIFISGLYSRTDMYDDAKDAVGEAFKLVELFESEVAQESSTSRAFADRGWGGGKSVEELWADVFAARGQLLLGQNLKHEARVDFERAVQHLPNHPEAIVGLSNILLDIYTGAISLEPSTGSSIAAPSVLPSVSPSSDAAYNSKTAHLTAHTPSAENQISPPELNRLAARDRAYGLLSTLTKLGAGWDYSEAWYALARAYEESGQVEKMKDVLWWCVELEDTHPVRSWKDVTLGGFVL
ncbi:filamentation protein-like protein [Lentithecium fluviatile CBS 122367]|uniref:Filamentation protein-like protein n=1 Tax=Lentithecium fluviatile CBS 122367 TaxID=1168545 RepID=A0A6G1IRT4_9PLEO|nr:filamentation protein-like protein [Lentithecium fluviatile CBS 122367]